MPKLFLKLAQSTKQKNALNQNGESISAVIIPVLGKASFKARNSVALNDELRPLLGQEFYADVTEKEVTFTRADGTVVKEWQIRVSPQFTSTPVLREKAIEKLAEQCEWECLVVFPEAR